MRKALRIVTVTAGIVSIVSAVVLGCMYLEDIAGVIKKMKSIFSGRLFGKKGIDEE